MANFQTIEVPAFEFHYNLAVCPLPDKAVKVVRFPICLQNQL